MSIRGPIQRAAQGILVLVWLSALVAACSDSASGGAPADDLSITGDAAADTGESPDGGPGDATAGDVAEDAPVDAVDDRPNDSGEDPDDEVPPEDAVEDPVDDTADASDASDTATTSDTSDAGDLFSGDLADLGADAVDPDALDAAEEPPLLCTLDSDGDERGADCELGPDCDDEDGDNWISCATCVDADLDHSFIGCDRYVVRLGPDCADDDPLAFQVYEDVYVDDDGDGFGAGAPDTACGGYDLPLTASAQDGDCDDSRSAVHPLAVELPNDALDNDCAEDGDLLMTDETGVFVDAVNGADPVETEPRGTQAEPYKTIGAAMAEADSRGVPIFLAAGTYDEAVTTTTSIFGGFCNDAGTWTRDIESCEAIIQLSETPSTSVVIAIEAPRVALDGLTILANGLADSDPESRGIEYPGSDCEALYFGNLFISLEASSEDVNTGILVGSQGDACYVQLRDSTIEDNNTASDTIVRMIDVTSAYATFLEGNTFKTGLSAGGTGVSVDAADIGATSFSVAIGNTVTIPDETRTGQCRGIAIVRFSDDDGLTRGRVSSNDVICRGTTFVIGIHAMRENGFFEVVDNDVVVRSVNGNIRGIGTTGGMSLAQRNRVSVTADSTIRFAEGMTNSSHAQVTVYVNNAVELFDGNSQVGFDLNAGAAYLVNNTFASGGAPASSVFGVDRTGGSLLAAVNNNFQLSDTTTMRCLDMTAAGDTTLARHNDCYAPVEGLEFVNGITSLDDFNDCEAWAACRSTGGNRDDPSSFEAFEGFNYRVGPNDPVVDEGADPADEVGATLDEDIEGNPRPVDLTHEPERPGTFDIGAYEVPPPE